MATQDSSNIPQAQQQKEEWRDVPGWEGIYLISNKGRCKRVANGVDGRRLPERILKPKKSGWNGEYRAYILNWGDRVEYVYAHRAVLLAFVDASPDESFQANHKDGDKTHNSVENLEWVTPTENQQHRYTVLDQSQNGEKNPANKYSRKRIERVLSLYRTGKYTQRKIAKMTGIDYRYVNRIVKRQSWAHLD